MTVDFGGEIGRVTDDSREAGAGLPAVIRNAAYFAAEIDSHPQPLIFSIRS